jgi:sugar-specific transcriptional regulator TrmB
MPSSMRSPRTNVTKAELAKAASIPSGSLHSVLVSLGKKGMIRTERQGSAQFRAIYEVVETSRESTRSLNGVVHDKEALAKTLQPTR